MRILARLARLCLLLPLAGCGARSPVAGPLPAGLPGAAHPHSLLPPVPPLRGPLEIRVVYPGGNDPVDARDSTFLFGSVGDGGAEVWVDDAPARVWPNGAWLAWVAVPSDSVTMFRISARSSTDSVQLELPIKRTPRFQIPLAPVWIDSTSFTPGGRVWWPADEDLPISLRAAKGAEVRLRLPDGTVLPLAPDAGAGEVPWGIRAFDRDTTRLDPPREATRYAGVLRGRAVGTPRGSILASASAESPSGAAAESLTVEAILGADTARAAWPLSLALLDSLPVVVELNDDTAATGGTDSLIVGRARPGATYHWFLPTGTRAVATGRLGADLRLRLSRQQEVWIPAGDAIPLPPATPAVRATVLSITITPGTDRIAVRIPLTARVPFRIEEAPGQLVLRVYNAVSDINWTRYGPNDPYLRDVRWLQAASDEVTITLDLGGPVWGYRTRWSRHDLILELRRPPMVVAAHPLRGRMIVVDPGHPPAGATGPTGLREADANLGVALELARLLRAAGARVILTRDRDVSLDLQSRVRLADSLDAELLVSIHNNALPDGVNPFTNNGSSVFYNQPRSLPLAQDIQAALVRRLGLRDLGVGRGDLALVRPTWMPAVLCEGLFMMLPDQEAALRSAVGQRLYALAVRDGLITFLKRVATRRGSDVP